MGRRVLSRDPPLPILASLTSSTWKNSFVSIVSIQISYKNESILISKVQKDFDFHYMS